MMTKMFIDLQKTGYLYNSPKVTEYSCNSKSRIRKFGNRSSGTRKSPFLCLITCPFLQEYQSRPCHICGAQQPLRIFLQKLSFGMHKSESKSDFHITVQLMETHPEYSVTLYQRYDEILNAVFKSEHPYFIILNTPCSSLNCINI